MIVEVVVALDTSIDSIQANEMNPESKTKNFRGSLYYALCIMNYELARITPSARPAVRTGGPQ